MKTTIWTLFVLTFFVNAQSQVQPGPTLTYANTQDIDFAANIPNGTNFTSYTSKDGSVIHIGDTLVIGRPSTRSNDYTHLYFGKYSFGRALLTGPPIPLGGNYQMEKVVIFEIWVSHTKASRKSAMFVWLYVKNPAIAKIIANRTIYDYEKAFMMGEVINPRATITRTEAIAKLKESKDLLDLGIITQVKFDSIKTALTPIITKN